VAVVAFEESHYKLLSHLEDTNEISIWNEIGRNRSVHVMLNKAKAPGIIQLFTASGMKPELMIDDVQKLIDMEEVQSRSGGARGVLDAFLTFDEIKAYLNQMVSSYPALASLQTIGRTVENREMLLFKCGKGPKQVFMDFGIHAREWISPSTGLYIINELLTKYAQGGDSKTMLDTWTFHIIPVLNPDGYAYSHTRDRMWRKNRRPGSCVGVDLNRNYGYMWNTGGSSGSPCADTYHGGAPMSENEAKAMESYMTGKPWDCYLTFHSYGQWWFTNWGYTTANPPQYDELKRKATIGANAIRAVNGRAYTIGSSAQLLYIASGGSEDWTRGTLNIFYSYCLELPPTGGTGFIAPVSEIVKTGAETFAGVVAFLKAL